MNLKPSALNLVKVSMRDDWSISPCNRSAAKPCLTNDLQTISTSRFRLQKIKPLRGSSFSINLRKVMRFSFCPPPGRLPSECSTITKAWVMVSAVWAGRLTVISFGLLKNFSAKDLISLGIVAENSNVVRIGDNKDTIFSTSGIKPMSNIRSASSITRVRTSFINK